MKNSAAAPDARPAVVLVDDDKAVRSAVAFSLETEGYSVRAFANARSLLAEPDTKADCYVVDEMIPGDMRGIELIVMLRANGIVTPVILITTNPSRDLRRRAELLDTPIVEKPLLGSGLAKAIGTSLRQHHLRSGL
jgi:FixJ family two-component response regulator